MDLEHENTDPFTIDDLWRPSGFALQSLQPLEPLQWDEKLPGRWSNIQLPIFCLKIETNSTL